VDGQRFCGGVLDKGLCPRLVNAARRYRARACHRIIEPFFIKRRTRRKKPFSVGLLSRSHAGQSNRPRITCRTRQSLGRRLRGLVPFLFFDVCFCARDPDLS
jgi:hypothetical protein